MHRSSLAILLIQTMFHTCTSAVSLCPWGLVFSTAKHPENCKKTSYARNRELMTEYWWNISQNCLMTSISIKLFWISIITCSHEYHAVGILETTHTHTQSLKTTSVGVEVAVWLKRSDIRLPGFDAGIPSRSTFWNTAKIGVIGYTFTPRQP